MDIQWTIDSEGQDFVLDNEWDTVIPVSFDRVGETLKVSVYPAVEQKMRAHFAHYGNNPFSDEALSALWATLAPFMEEWGYHDDKFRDRWGHILSFSPDDSLVVTPFPDTRRLKAEDEDGNQTTFDLEMSAEEGLLGFGTVRNGQVVSLAMTHSPLPETPSVIEVGVETIPSARKQGLAKSNLSALISALSEKGHRVEYRCQRYNHASRKTALGVGMTVVGQYYYYVGRKI